MLEGQPEHRERVAVVTGGSSGIGSGIAHRLQQEGASVNVLDITVPTTGEVSERSFRPISYYQLDVSEEEAVNTTFERIAAREGKIDYLVNCAAIFSAKPFLELTSSDWHKTLKVNLTGSFLCCRATILHMLRQGFGRIVLFSSELARTGSILSAPYAASKAGVLGLARSLALEVASENIRVNTVSPGITDAPQPRGHLSDEQLQTRGTKIPLGRIGSVQDMVEGPSFS